MALKKRTIAIEKERYVKWLSELSKDDIPLVGGKGANLAEMYNNNFPVPPAFCITAQAFDTFLTEAGLKEEIKKIVTKTNVFNTEELEKNADQIRKLIINSTIPEEMQEEILEAYSLLSTEKTDKVLEDEEDTKNKKIKEGKGVFVAVRSSATTEDLADASFAGQQETYTNVRGEKNLLLAVRKCFASLYTARAVYYRHKKGFEKANALLSVVVQKMINSEKSGVMFTKNPMNSKNEIIIESVFGLGEGIVSGKILPDHYVLSPDLDLIEKKIANKKIALEKEDNGNGIVVKLSEEKSKSQVLTLGEISTLGDIGQRIEKHYKKPQDIEFAVEKDKIYIVQSRPITTLKKEKDEAEQEKKDEQAEGKIKGEVILSGLAASPGIATGPAKVVHDMKELGKVKKGDILVTEMTNPDMVITMQRSVAIVTDEGGATSHAAIVSREMGIPCVTGTEKATQILTDGQIITVDGTSGKVYKGKVENSKDQIREIQPIVKTKTKIKVMLDLPDYAERASKTGCEAVGLVRLEGTIAESGKHPLLFVKENNTQEYSKIIEKSLEKISKHFQEIWIRTSDIRSDEYMHLQGAPQEKELNPMLGFHGIRFSLKNLPLLEAELGAIKRIAEKNPNKKFGIMFPQIITEEEIESCYKLYNSKFKTKNIILGAMIETPAAVQIIRAICKYVKFISFGTNDLTQYTLAVDRGNSECQYLYNEMHPAILSQIKRVISICKEYNVETSICGQAGSRKEMAEFLVRQGITSISTNADAAHDVSVIVSEIEESEKNKNPVTHDKNMPNKIVPIDDTQEIEDRVKSRKEELSQGKEEQEKQEQDSTEVIRENTKQENQKAKNKNQDKNKESQENKEASSENKELEKEEFPEFEIGFDPFAEQGK